MANAGTTRDVEDVFSVKHGPMMSNISASIYLNSSFIPSEVYASLKHSAERGGHAAYSVMGSLDRRMKVLVIMMIVSVAVSVVMLICISVVCYRVFFSGNSPFGGRNNSASNNSAGDNLAVSDQQTRIDERRLQRAAKYEELKAKYGIENEVLGRRYPHIGVQISNSREKLLKQFPGDGLESDEDD